MNTKPLGIKNYGHIPHFPGSRMGPGDHKCNEGQLRIATEKARDKYDIISISEKLDGSNCGIALYDGIIYALTRSGYEAKTSPYKMHHLFHNWVYENENRFRDVLQEGERLVGEWLVQAHGTKYALLHEPFVAFDLMTGSERITYFKFIERIGNKFVIPTLIHVGEPLSISKVMKILNGNGEKRETYGFHGALEPVEGAVWRVERNAKIHNNSSERKLKVDFLAKYVRPDKQDGIYLKEGEIWNEYK